MNSVFNNTYLAQDNDGQWILRLDEKSTGINIPENLALLIQTMLEWEKNRSDEKTSEILRKINCHKTILYLTGLISPSEFIADPRIDKNSDSTFNKRASAISQKEFVLVKNEMELRSLAGSCCQTGKICIGQIFNEELGHSFIVGKVEDEDKFICFDKAGFTENLLKNNKDFKFRVYEISKLLESPNYQNASWRFVPIEEIF